jgi:hypothetical protein
MPENGKEYSMEIVERAEDLYCVDGHTLEQLVTLTGVSISTLKRWSIQYGWSEKRENIRRARSAIRTNRVLLHAKLIENCLKTLSPMDAFAVSSIEGAVQRAAQLAAKGQAREAPAEVLREIKTEADAIAALEQAVEIKINRLLSNPEGLSFAAMKEIKQALDLLKDMRARQPASDAGSQPSGLSEAAADEIRRKILGIK